MTVITNYSDLSPAMRAALINGHAGEATRHALEARGLVKISTVTGPAAFALTEAGQRAVAVLTNPDTPPPPAKVAPLLDRATAGGLTVKWDDFGLQLETAGIWTITSPNPVDNTEVWIHWTKGPNGGRLNMRRYYPNLPERQRVVKLTRQGVIIALDMMIRSLARHLERQQAEVDRLVAECTLGTINEALEAAEKSGAEHYIELYSMAKAKFMANARAALGQVFAELDGAVVDSPASIPPDALLECGCPARVAADCGHQEGCATLEQPDPTRRGWFMIDQIIIVGGDYLQVCAVESGLQSGGKVARVAVTINGGAGGKWWWYGDHPDAIGLLSRLEGGDVGLPESMKRAWPRTGHAAKVAVENLLQEQCLSGWVAASSHTEVHIHLQAGTDPYRHSVLIPRYLPYRDATVTVRPGAMIGPTIVIKHEER